MAAAAMPLPELERWVQDRADRRPVAASVPMLDGYVAAIVAGPVSIDPPDWICPLLAVDTDAFNHAITAAPRSSRGDLRRRATSQRHQPRSIDHSETVRADAPAQVQWRSRSASLAPRTLRCQ